MALVGDNGAGKSTLIKCVAGIHPMDEGEIFFDGKPVSIHSPKEAAQARDRGRLPGSRALRQPRRRPEHVPRPRGARPVPAAEGAADGGEDGRDAEDARGDDDQVDPPAGRDALGRPAPVGRGRPRGDVELAARDPRRADRRARRRRRPSRCSSSSSASPSRASASILISHNLHDIFEVADRITVLRLGRDIGVYERAKTTQEEVVHAITAGTPTKVSGIPGTGHGGDGMTTDAAAVVGRSRAAELLRARADATSARATSAARPVIVALVFVVLFFSFDRAELLHAGQLHRT